MPWLPTGALALMVASDYKFRVRPAGSSSADSSVLLEIAIYGLVAAFLIWRFASPIRLRRRMPRPMYFVSVYVLLMIASLVQAPSRTVATVRAVEMSVLLLLTWMAANRGSRKAFADLASSFLVMVAASVFLGLAIKMPRYHLQEGRFTWLRVHPVVSGVYLSIAVVIAASMLLQTNSRPARSIMRVPVCVVLLAIVVSGLLATKTRGAVLGAVAGLLVLVWFARRGRARVETATTLVVFIVLIALAGSSVVTAYLARGESTAQLATLNSRTSLWDLALNAIAQRPLFGYGVGASHVLFLDQTGLGGAHNAYLNVTVDLGVVGLVVWSAILITTGTTIFRSAVPTADFRVERALMLALLACLLVNGFSNGGLGDESNVSADWMFLLAAWSTVRTREVRLQLNSRQGSDPDRLASGPAGTPTAAASAHDPFAVVK